MFTKYEAKADWSRHYFIHIAVRPWHTSIIFLLFDILFWRFIYCLINPSTFQYPTLYTLHDLFTYYHNPQLSGHPFFIKEPCYQYICHLPFIDINKIIIICMTHFPQFIQSYCEIEFFFLRKIHYHWTRIILDMRVYVSVNICACVPVCCVQSINWSVGRYAFDPRCLYTEAVCHTNSVRNHGYIESPRP